MRNIDSIEVNRADGLPDYLFAHDGEGDRIVQVQVNAIKPEPQPRSQRARMAKFAKEDAERADPKRPGWFSDRIAEVQHKPERKAKRAKGAK